MKKLTRPVLLAGNSEICPDIYYSSGFRTTDPVVFLKHGKKKYLVVSELELGRAQKECATHHVNVFTPRLLNLRKGKQNRFSEWAAALMSEAGVKTVYVQPQFPHGLAVALKKKQLRVIAAKENLFPERLVKKRDEISRIKESQQAAVIAMRSAINEIAHARVGPGGELRSGKDILTSEYVRGVIGQCLLAHQCMGRDTIVACGKDSADPHSLGAGPLYANQPIVIDIFPQNMEHGYWGDLTRTVMKGAASGKLKKMYNAVKAAQTAALHHVKPGVKCSTVNQAVVNEYSKRGFSTELLDGRMEGFIHSTGHGVGLQIHERPSVSAMSEERLRAGNIITIEPGLYYSDIGGIRIEDTIEVVPGGWRYLVPCEKKFSLQ